MFDTALIRAEDRASRLRPARVFMLLLAAALMVLSWTHTLDTPAGNYLDGALKRTLITFAIARALNGSISMLQDADLSISPAGVGVTVSPGELLDPINDLIEQFSTILLAASISLGAQKILLGISGAAALSALLTASLLAACLVQLVDRGSRWRRGLLRLSALLVLLRFFVPAYALASQAIDRQFLEPRFAEASAALDISRSEAEAATQQAQTPLAPSPGISDRVVGWFREAGETLDIRARVSALLLKLGAVSDHIVTLSVVFLMQSVLLPLLFLTLGGYALRQIWSLGGSDPRRPWRRLRARRLPHR